jgi:hypothetical protein
LKLLSPADSLLLGERQYWRYSGGTARRQETSSERNHRNDAGGSG